LVAINAPIVELEHTQPSPLQQFARRAHQLRIPPLEQATVFAHLELKRGLGRMMLIWRVWSITTLAILWQYQLMVQWPWLVHLVTTVTQGLLGPTSGTQLSPSGTGWEPMMQTWQELQQVILLDLLMQYLQTEQLSSLVYMDTAVILALPRPIGGMLLHPNGIGWEQLMLTWQALQAITLAGLLPFLQTGQWPWLDQSAILAILAQQGPTGGIQQHLDGLDWAPTTLTWLG
jgi:hypothetical protein